MSIQERILFLLRQQKKTQKDLCLSIGVQFATLNRWLKEERSIPAECIVGISDFFGVPVYYLLTGQDEIKSGFKAIDINGNPVTLSQEQQELLKLRANQALTKRILEVMEDAHGKSGG